MWLNVFLFVIIIALNVYSATLSYSFYSTSKKNHYRFRHVYTISILLSFQCVLAIYYLCTGDSSVSSARFMAFNLAEVSMFYFIIRSYPNRHFELIITSVFTIIILVSAIWMSLFYNILIALILISLSLLSKDDVLIKWFSISFMLYGLTSIVPTIFGFTHFESILMGLIFTIHFTLGVRKLYHKEKTDDELKKLILEDKL